MPECMEGRKLLLCEYIERTWLMWSIAGMTVARLGVKHEKYNVVSLRT